MRSLGVSADGQIVDFGFQVWGEIPARFDAAKLALKLGPSADKVTAAPRQDGLPVAGWKNTTAPTLAGRRLPLAPYEISRALAIAPDGKSFVLGTEWWLRAFDTDGKQRWRIPVPGVAWAVNISGDGRLVVAALGDGTIRWYRLDNGQELLAFFLLTDRSNWVAWTPEGYYAATSGARGILKWQVNRGWDQAAETFPVEDIPGSFRPEIIKRVLQEGDIIRALGLAENERHREEVRKVTGGTPGAKLHVLTVGIDDYGAKSALSLKHAAADARDVLAALKGEKGGYYADVLGKSLQNREAKRIDIRQALADMAVLMQNSTGNDTAVIALAAHGVKIGDDFYLMTHGVDTSSDVAMQDSALSGADLAKELVKLSEKGRVVVLIDTCRSGAMPGAVTDAQAISKRLAVNNRILVLTASAADESARESDKLGHGVFSFAAMEAFDKADTDRNGVITASEFVHYVKSRVQGIGGQEPQVQMNFDGNLFSARLR